VLAFPPVKLRWIVIAVIAVVAAAVTAVVVVASRSTLLLSSEPLRQRILAALSQRLDGDVELGSLSVRMIPFHAEGARLTIRHRGHGDEPPLISVRSFTVDGDLLGLYRKHVASVELVGLDIEIPPRRGEKTPDPAGPGLKGDIVVDHLRSTDARLVIIPRDRDKPPKVWDIHRLHMHSVGNEQAMPFEATLTNAIPPGEIETTGHFGPWQREDPGSTPLDGTFDFEKVDLGVFKGISGILSAHGTFGGALASIDVHGDTTTPQFTVKVGGHPVPLHAAYHAVVDGTNGDTRLERIDGSFLNTSLVARGAVLDVPGADGRRVSLDVTIDRGRLEDVLRLAVSTPQPPMRGALRLHTDFELPPGDRDVVEKLRLNGRFTIARGQFTSNEIQQKIAELSQRAQGNRKADTRHERVTSDFAGRFTLASGVLKLPTVTFNVPGADVRLSGRYALRQETLDFQGQLIMDAKVSQTVDGFKSILLKAVDPIFRRDGRTVIPIKITGTRHDPSFGLDRGRLLRNRAKG
jgi:hypothetical protein